MLQVSTRLAEAADDVTERRYRSAHHSLRGIRGVPMAEVARIGHEAALAAPPELPRDREALEALFTSGWEDGLVAVGLLATCVAATPAEALDLGLVLAERTDDPTTADALGWLVVGPATLALGGDPASFLDRLASHARPDARRVAVAAALAATPAELEGAAAAPLRAVLRSEHASIVDEIRPRFVAAVIGRLLRDPELQKPLRRVLKVWAAADAPSLLAWVGTVKGGLPTVLSAEIRKVRGAR